MQWDYQLIGSSGHLARDHRAEFQRSKNRDYLYERAWQVLEQMSLPTCAKIDVVLDLEEFVRIPRTYFQAVRRREPQQLAEATETVIFQRLDFNHASKCIHVLRYSYRSVKFFQQLEALNLRPLVSEQEFESCDLRVLETTPKQAWKTVRRIVISSSAGEKQYWCKEFCKFQYFPLALLALSYLAKHWP